MALTLRKGYIMKGLTGFLAAATAALLPKADEVKVKDPLKGYAVVSKTMQGYLTGQHKPSMRPVYRAMPVDRSRYTPHQGAQECARRVRQGLAG